MIASPFEYARLEARDRTGDHYITVGGDNWTPHAKDITVEFREDAGGSRLTFNSRAPMEKRTGRPVQVWVGEGKEMVELFTGKLIRPAPDPPSFTSAATGLGPIAQMSENSFGEFVDYSGLSRRSALQNVISRAGYSQGTAYILGPASAILEEQVFNEEVSLLEGAQGINGEVYTMTDTGSGRRIFLPKPLAGKGATSSLDFAPADYSAFTVEDEFPTSYSRVVVFARRDTAGTGLRASVEVRQRPGVAPAPKNRIKYITDFSGTDDEALQHAYDWALRLYRGEVKWSVSGLDLRYVQRYSRVLGSRVVERADGFWREEYALTTDDGATYNVSTWEMEMGGLGVLLSETKVGRLRLPSIGPSAQVLRTRPDLQTTTGTRAAQWGITALPSVTNTRAVAWGVTGPLQGARSLSYGITGAIFQVTNTRPLSWGILASLTATRQAQWSIASSVTNIQGTRAMQWDIQQQVTATRAMQWAIASTITSVTNTRALAWSVLNTATGTRQAQWDILSSAAAAPTIQGTPGLASNNGNSTSMPTALPTGVTLQNNDILLLAVVTDEAQTITGMTGWSSLGGSSNVGDLELFWKRTTGSETAPTGTLGNTDRTQTKMWCIRGAHTTTAPARATYVPGTSTTPDPGTVTPSWGSANNLYIALAGIDTPTLTALVSGPAGYNNAAFHMSGGSQTGACALASADRADTSTSEDPGVFTLDTSQTWNATVVAVRPA